MLCASYAECKTFYHVKNKSHPRYKQCTLTNWDGTLPQFAQNDCCDSGFQCSQEDMMAPLKQEIKRLNGALDVRQHTFGEKDANLANERNLEKQRLDTRQKIIVGKDTNVAVDKKL